jgi:hypothetical protein
MKRLRQASLLLSAVTIVGVSLWFYSKAPSTPKVSITVGFTNYQAGARHVVFRLGNLERRLAVTLTLASVEVKTSAGWRPLPGVSRGDLAVLRAGEAESFAIPDPAGADDWRLKLDYLAYPDPSARFQNHIARIQSMLGIPRNCRKGSFRTCEIQANRSPDTGPAAPL